MEPGPQNAVLGDAMELPSTQVPEAVLNEEKNLAKFSRTKEFKRLKEYLEARIKFFQNHFPDGTPLAKETDHQKVADYWRVANIVIAEFHSLLDVYENANQVVNNDPRTNRRI